MSRPNKNKIGRQRSTKSSGGDKTTLWVGIGILVFVGIVLSIALLGRGGGAGNDIADLQFFGNPQAGIHSQGKLNYPNTPPIGGPHNPGWQTCGIYNQPIENEYAVHSMEHGAVWIAYDPALGAEAINTLKGLVRGKSYTLLAPYPGIPAPIVATAWGYQLKVSAANDARLPLFITRFANGSQTPEPGASCSGSNGTPDER